MYTIRMPSGNYLEGDFKLSFELNNQVFSSSDATVIPGSFSFPAEAPLTPVNRAELNFPDMVTNAANWKTYDDVWVELYGVPMFRGVLTIRTCNPKKVSFNIVANPLNALKQVKMNELDLGGDRTFADEAAVLAHASATAADPLNNDYVFFPVFNPDYINHPDYSEPKSYYQNFYNPLTSAFQVDHGYPAIMPFARLEYIIERIFAGQGYHFRNRWQTTDELRKLCVYNNRSLWTDEGIETTINLKNHVSETVSTAFLRKIMSGFNLGLFTRVFNRTIDLVPLRDIINRPAVHDWTQYAISDPVRDGRQEQADYLCWKVDDGDGTFAWYAKQVKPDPADVDGTILSTDIATVAPGIYYVEDQHAYFSIDARVKHVFTELGCAPTSTGKSKFEAESPAMWDAHKGWEAYIGSASENFGMRKMPQMRMPGTVSYQLPPVGADPAEVVNTQQAIPDRITFYRGLYQIWGGTATYPLASGLPWDAKANLIGAHSLRWDGEYGMYESFWKEWHQVLLNGKPVTQQFALPVGVLTEFSFEDKIRVKNMEYFATKLKIGKALGYGKVLVESSLYTTI